MAKHNRHTSRSGSPRHEPNRCGINGDHPWTRLTGKHDHDLGIMRPLGIIGFVSVLSDCFLGTFCSHGIELYHELSLNHSLGRTCFGSHFVFQLRSSRHFVTSRGEGSVWCTLIRPLDQLVLKGLKCRPTNCCCFIYSFFSTILLRYTSMYIPKRKET